MISKQEILQIATNTKLSAQVVEKDYVLGWILAGINQHSALKDAWVFKGGTCLKKCYFESYRFSEDLDFTLLNNSHLDFEFLKNTFSEIADWLYEKTGIELPIEKMVFDQYKDGTCQCRIYYRGPITPTSHRQMPKIKLDLTTKEIIVDEPVRNKLYHPYSDSLLKEIQILCYSYIELFAEKTRALAERARPRDLYDVVHFYRRPESKLLAMQVRHALDKKCAFKGIQVPQYHDLLVYESVCRAGWNVQLEHQLQSLPSFESFWSELPNFFNWLERADMTRNGSY